MPLSFPANPTVGQTYLNWTWNGQAWVVTTAVAPPFSNNYIDNSGFTINQRGYASGAALAANAYGFDRWKAGSGGCTLNFTFSFVDTLVTIAAGSITQVVDGTTLLSTPYILSWQGTAVCSVNGAATVPSPVVVDATAGANLTLNWQGGTLGQVQLELGTVISPWQPEPPGVELMRCQRFYQGWLAAMWGNAGGNGTGVGYSQALATPMRANPTVTIVSSTGGGTLAAPTASQISVSIGIVQVVSIATGSGAGSFTVNGFLSADL